MNGDMCFSCFTGIKIDQKQMNVKKYPIQIMDIPSKNIQGFGYFWIIGLAAVLKRFFTAVTGDEKFSYGVLIISLRINDNPDNSS